MKWLFLLLLIVNAAIFAWGYQQEQMPQPAVEAGGDLGNMRLISELVEEKTAASAAEPEHDEKAEPLPKKEIEAKVASTNTDLEATASGSKPEQSDQPQTQPEIVSKCGIIGPLKDHQLAKDIKEDLSKAELKAKLKRKIDKEQVGYWVVIPPVKDGSQAKAKIEELTQVGIKDIMHFRGGGMKNAISLGMFAQKENAENFSKEVLIKGFETEIRPRYVNKTSYLVKFTISKPKNVAENMWSDIQEKYSKLPLKKQSCK